VGLKLATAAPTALRACVDTSYTHVKGSASSFQGAGGRVQARQGANVKKKSVTIRIANRLELVD